MADRHPEEELLQMRLADIQRAYAAEAKPIVDRIVQIRSARVPVIRIRADMVPAELLERIKHG